MKRLAGKLGSLVSKESLFRNVTILAGGTAFGQILTIAVSPLLTRLYTPEHFGLLGIFTAIVSILAMVVALRYEQAIPLPESLQEAFSVLILCLIMTCFFNIPLILIVLFFAKPMSAFINAPALAPFLWLIPLSLLGTGLYQALTYWAIRQKQYPLIARTRILQSLGQVLVQVAAGILQLGALGLILGQVIGRVSGSGSLTRATLKENHSNLRAITLEQLGAAAYRYRKFPLYSSSSALLNSLVLQAPTLLIAFLYKPDVVGWYALASRIIGLPFTFIGQAVAQAYMGEIATAARNTPKSLSKVFSRTIRSQLILIVPIVGIIMLFAPLLFQKIFGESWLTSGQFAQILAPMYGLQFIASPLGSTLAVLEKQEMHLIREILRVGLVFTALFAAYAFDLQAEQTLILLSMAASLGYLIHLWTSWKAIRAFSVRQVANA